MSGKSMQTSNKNISKECKDVIVEKVYNNKQGRDGSHTSHF